MGIDVYKFALRTAGKIRKKELEKVENAGFSDLLMGSFGLSKPTNETEKQLMAMSAKEISKNKNSLRDKKMGDQDFILSRGLSYGSGFSSVKPGERKARLPGKIKQSILGKKSVFDARKRGVDKAADAVFGDETGMLNEQKMIFNFLGKVHSDEVKRRQVERLKSKSQFEGLI